MEKGHVGVMCIDLALTTNSALGPRAKFLRSGLNPALPQVNEIQTWVNADPGWVNASFDLALTRVQKILTWVNTGFRKY